MWTGKRCCKNGSVDAKLIVLIVCTLGEGAGVRAAMRVFAFLIRYTIIIITRRHRWVEFFAGSRSCIMDIFPRSFHFAASKKQSTKSYSVGL